MCLAAFIICQFHILPFKIGVDDSIDKNRVSAGWPRSAPTFAMSKRHPKIARHRRFQAIAIDRKFY